MSILNIVKADPLPKLIAALSKNQATADRVRTDRGDTVTALADIEQRLAIAVIEQDGNEAALQTERTRLADRIVTLDLALRKSDSDADSLRLQIAAATNRQEREAVASQLEAQADSIEKVLAPLRKYASQLFEVYNNNSRAAAEMTPASNPQILAYGVDFAAAFIAGDALDLLIEADRQTARDIREGRRDPAQFKATYGGQFEAFHGKKKVVAS